MNRALPLITALFLFPAVASAQAGDRGGPPRYVEVERGLYATGLVGAGILLEAPADADGEAPTVAGLSMGLAVGVDLFDVLQVEAFGMGVPFSAPTSYSGLGGPADPRGDFTTALVGGRVRFAVLRLPDVQGTRRLHVNLQAGGGVLFSEPSTMLGERQPMALGGLGVRYYTRMRHFSVGLDVDGAWAMDSESLFLIPQASLSYTF